MTSFETIGAAAGVCGIMITMDIVAGVLSAATRGELNTQKLRIGLFHKLALVLTFVLAVAIEYACEVLPMGVTIPLVLPVATYIALMEACSVYENIKRINPDVKVEKFEDLFKFSHGTESDKDNNMLTEEALNESKARILYELYGDRVGDIFGDDYLRAVERYMQKFIDEQKEGDSNE